LPNLVQNRAEIFRRACDRGRTKRCDAVLRQERGDACDGTGAIEGVVPVKTVDVDIDEAGRNVTICCVDDTSPGRIDSAGLNGRDAARVDNERAPSDDSPGQYQIATADDDHGALVSPAQSM
jgi:hypothetical protein